MPKRQLKTGTLVILCTWVSLLLSQGTNKSQFSGPTSSNGPCNGFSPVSRGGRYEVYVMYRTIYKSTAICRVHKICLRYIKDISHCCMTSNTQPSDPPFILEWKDWEICSSRGINCRTLPSLTANRVERREGEEGEGGGAGKIISPSQISFLVHPVKF